MENLWNDAIPYWNEEFIEADETAVRKPTITAYPANDCIYLVKSGIFFRKCRKNTAEVFSCGFFCAIM